MNRPAPWGAPLKEQEQSMKGKTSRTRIERLAEGLKQKMREPCGVCGRPHPWGEDLSADCLADVTARGIALAKRLGLPVLSSGLKKFRKSVRS